MKQIRKTTAFLFIIFIFFSCHKIQEEKYLEKINSDLQELDSIKLYIENEHKTILYDSTKKIILFPDQKIQK